MTATGYRHRTRRKARNGARVVANGHSDAGGPLGAHPLAALLDEYGTPERPGPYTPNAARRRDLERADALAHLPGPALEDAANDAPNRAG